MQKIKITKPFKIIFSEKLMDLGNLTIATMVFGQFIAEKPFSINIFISGIILSGMAYIGSLYISQ